MIGVNEFNQSYFDKIDQIDVDIANGLKFETIVENFNLKVIKKKNFKFSTNNIEIENKIFELRNNNFDIFEIGDDYILYNIDNINVRKPDLNDEETKNEIMELVAQKDKFEYNRKLLEKIKNNKFDNSDFSKMGQNMIETIKLNSIRDNNKFEINSVQILYSIPINSFTLINDEKNNIYLAKIKKIENQSINDDQKILNEYINKHNSNSKNEMLKSYDLYLNNKYKVTLNQKTIERVKNFFQ